jgi:energy-coupling factor transport system ATP-binding protein
MARLGDDVAFGLENLGVARGEIWPRVRAALDAVGLDLPLDHATAALSGGQRQRLALAGVLAMRPGLILLDEPTANLDPAGVHEVRDAVARTAHEAGATLVVIEHRVSVWLPVVDRIIVLGTTGGLLADGHPDEVLGSRAAELRAAGVWLPDEVPWHAPSPAAGSEHPLLTPSTWTSRGCRERPCCAGSTPASARAASSRSPDPMGSASRRSTHARRALRPDSGRLEPTARLAAGCAVNQWRWRSRDLLTRIGTVFQSPEHQFLTASVRAELEVAPGPSNSARRAPRSRRGTARVLRLDRLAEANPFTLSGGEKRRLSVATAIAARPRMLVLDEPTFGQDATTWRELGRLIVALRDDGVGVVAVTHDEPFVDAIADHRLELGAARGAAAEHGDRR